MTSKKTIIHVRSMGSPLQGHIVIIGERTIGQHTIPRDGTITFQFGMFTQQVKVISAPHLDGIRISPGLAIQAGLHDGVQLGLQYKPASRTLVVGPLIGVMVSRIGSDMSRPFGNMTTFCKELVDACQRYGAFAIFFSAADIPSHHQLLEGWTYSDSTWRKSVFPIPDVVYNRLNTRRLENNPTVQHFMKVIKARYGTAVFNEHYLDKTDVFDALRKDAAQHKYLPESYLFKNVHMLKTMLAKYNTIFLKPVTGSLGKGIIRIARHANQTYTCQYAEPSGTVRQTYSSIVSLYRTLAKKLKNRRYQIQQGLSLIASDGRPIDFRALVQRNGQGEWQVTSTVARIAGGNHFVSNIARGGTLSKVKEALHRSGLSPAQQRMAALKLNKAALDIANGVDAQVKGHFGELGVDLAVDMHGKVWLIEVNAKPSKNDGTPMGDGAIRPSVKQTIQYARYLAGY